MAATDADLLSILLLLPEVTRNLSKGYTILGEVVWGCINASHLPHNLYYPGPPSLAPKDVSAASPLYYCFSIYLRCTYVFFCSRFMEMRLCEQGVFAYFRPTLPLFFCAQLSSIYLPGTVSPLVLILASFA